MEYSEKLFLYPYFLPNNQHNNHFHAIYCSDSQPSAKDLHSFCFLFFPFYEHLFPFIPFSLCYWVILWVIPTTSSSPCYHIWQCQHRSHAEKPAASSTMLVQGTVRSESCSSSPWCFSRFLDIWASAFLLGYQVS